MDSDNLFFLESTMIANKFDADEKKTAAANSGGKTIKLAVFGSILFAGITIASILWKAHNIFQTPPPDYLKDFPSDTSNTTNIAPNFNSKVTAKIDKICLKFSQQMPKKISDYTLDYPKYTAKNNSEDPILIKCGITYSLPKSGNFSEIKNNIRQINNREWIFIPSSQDLSEQKREGLIWITKVKNVFIALWIPASAPSEEVLVDLTNFLTNFASD